MSDENEKDPGYTVETEEAREAEIEARVAAAVQAALRDNEVEEPVGEPVRRPRLAEILWLKQFPDQQWQAGIVTGTHESSPVFRAAMLQNGSSSLVTDTWDIEIEHEKTWRFPEA